MKFCYGLLFALPVVVFGLGRSVIAEPPPCTDPIVTWRQDEDPAFNLPAMETYWSDESQQAWMRCLVIDESDLRREAAGTIVIAIKKGMTPIGEFAPPLSSILADSKEMPATRLAAAQALIACDFRDSAGTLEGQLESVPMSVRLVWEPALARWDYRPARELWLETVKAGHSDSALYRLAIESLGQVGEKRATALLSDLVLSAKGTKLSDRFAAVDALARVSPEMALEISTTMLAANPGDPTKGARSEERLIGVRLLAAQDSEEAIKLLDEYADDGWNVVKGEALRGLVRTAPQLVVARAAEGIRDPDANIRAATVAALATSHTPDSVAMLAFCMKDRVPSIRTAARNHLLELATDESLFASVVAESEKVVNEEVWQGLEQSMLVLTKLQQRQVKQRLFALLDSPRDEVRVTSAWSLKLMAEKDWAPELLDALQKQIEELQSVPRFQTIYSMAHLVEAMGMLKYGESISVLRTMIPKSAPFHPQIRSGAIWSLGHLLEGNIDAGIVSEIESRLDDGSSFPAEYMTVRSTSAVALGQMNSAGSVELLRKWARSEGPSTTLGTKSDWAISRITGEPRTAPIPAKMSIGGWFVEPALPRKSSVGPDTATVTPGAK
jgi:hypothetical protein